MGDISGQKKACRRENHMCNKKSPNNSNAKNLMKAQNEVRIRKRTNRILTKSDQ